MTSFKFEFCFVGAMLSIVLFDYSLVILKHLCVRLSFFYAEVGPTTSATLMEEIAFEAVPLLVMAPRGGLIIRFCPSLFILWASDKFEFLFKFRLMGFSLCWLQLDYELLMSPDLKRSFGDLCLLILREELDC